MNDAQPELRFEARPDASCRFWIIGANNEVMVRSEWYANRSNAHRGFRDLVAVVNELNQNTVIEETPAPPDIAA